METTTKTRTTTVKAVAVISGSTTGGVVVVNNNNINNLSVSGTLHFISSSSGGGGGGGGGESSRRTRTEIRGKIRGLKPDCLHAFHIHSFGDTSNGCLSTGPHFNPHNKSHGSPTDLDRHAGDLGNILAGPDGVAEVSITDAQIPLSGQHSILGRAVVVHANPDDLGKGGHELSKTTGNAGARIGCGIIGLQSVVYGAARI